MLLLERKFSNSISFDFWNNDWDFTWPANQTSTYLAIQVEVDPFFIIFCSILGWLFYLLIRKGLGGTFFTWLLNVQGHPLVHSNYSTHRPI